MRLTGLEGRVAVVTGAASGIGRAIVRRLARERVRVAVVDVYETGLEELCRELREAAPQPYAADLTDPLEVMDLAKRVLGEVGDVSFLVNVAGGPVAPSHEDQLPPLPTRAVPIEEIDDIDWARILATNLTTAFLVCRAFVPALKARRGGRIVNFTSIAARRGSDRVGIHYAAAKGGVIGLTKTLALELGPHGITVNAIAPGFINTERMEAVAWGRHGPRATPGAAGRHPAGAPRAARRHRRDRGAPLFRPGRVRLGRHHRRQRRPLLRSVGGTVTNRDRGVSGAFRERRTLVWRLAFGLLVAGALGLGLLLANRFSGPLPPRTLSISTGRPGGAYHEFALEYRRLLARQGFELEVRPGAGSVETLERLSAGEVTAGFVQGGTATAGRSHGLVVLASVFLEPVWVFHRERIRLEYLSQLQGHRIAVGEPGSGAQALARRLLADNAVGPDNASLLELSGEEAATALTEGGVDAAFFVMSPRGELVMRLTRTPGLSLMSERRHLAYTSRHPFLTSVRLGEGVLDMGGNVPREEKVLLAATASLAVRADVHPDLVRLLLGAAESVHRRGDLLATGQRFPSEAFVELPLHEDARGRGRRDRATAGAPSRDRRGHPRPAPADGRVLQSQAAHRPGPASARGAARRRRAADDPGRLTRVDNPAERQRSARCRSSEWVTSSSRCETWPRRRPSTAASSG